MCSTIFQFISIQRIWESCPWMSNARALLSKSCAIQTFFSMLENAKWPRLIQILAHYITCSHFLSNIPVLIQLLDDIATINVYYISCMSIYIIDYCIKTINNDFFILFFYRRLKLLLRCFFQNLRLRFTFRGCVIYIPYNQ